VNRPSNVFNGSGTLIGEVDAQLVAYLMPHGFRTSDSTRYCQALQPNRKIDAVAVEVITIDDDVAKIYTHSKLETFILRVASIPLGHSSLDFDGTARRIYHAAELDQEAITHHLEDATCMLVDRRIETVPPMLPKKIERLLFIDFHEAAVSDNISGQDRRQPTLNMFLRHVVSRHRKQSPIFYLIYVKVTITG
jgi:hypothetical protein